MSATVAVGRFASFPELIVERASEEPDVVSLADVASNHLGPDATRGGIPGCAMKVFDASRGRVLLQAGLSALRWLSELG